MITVIHLSDLHFGTESPQVVASLIRQVADLSPDVVVISGDLTQRAKWREFHAARRFMDVIESKDCMVVVVPGNHDIPLYNPLMRVFRPFYRYRSVVGNTRVAVQQLGRLRFITVNSVRRERHASGFITASNRREVVNCVRDAESDDINVVVTHHPLGIDSLASGNDEHRGDSETCRAWHEAGVDFVLSGHVHRPFLINAREQLIASSVDKQAPMWILNAGTAISRRTRHDHPNSCNLLKFDETGSSNRVTVERWDYQSSLTTFSLADSQDVELRRSSAAADRKQSA